MTNRKESENALIITLVFEAPRARVWRAWADPEIVKQWWGPQGFTAPMVKIDLRVGGKYLNCMRAPDGRDYWSTGAYREIVEPERLVLTDSFSDEKGQVVLATYYGMSPDFPLEMQITVRFEAQNGKTKMTLEHFGIPPSDLDGARQGWNGSFDKLSGVLQQ